MTGVELREEGTCIIRSMQATEISINKHDGQHSRGGPKGLFHAVNILTII